MLQEDYISIKDKGGYRLLGYIWRVSPALAWKLDTRPEYWPKDEEIQARLLETARKRGLND